jgi:wyosine [tRNA(Phe)-imidazoG37] synthetase (radical SAM superfamily)
MIERKVRSNTANVSRNTERRQMVVEYVFGPVPSRRFGRSLGVNPIPFKVCSYSCVYCQIGRTEKLEIRRKIHFDTDEVVSSIVSSIEKAAGKLDYVTFMGDGEPTLAENLGEMARSLREVWAGKMALITNGSLFFMDDVREDALEFDVVSPTVAAGDEKIFRRMHRPHGDITLERVIDGLREFREMSSGELWAEVMLVQGVNDTENALQAICSRLEALAPARTYINVPVRPPAEKWVKVPSRDSIETALRILPRALDMSSPEVGEFQLLSESKIDALLEIARNHPLREEQLTEMLSVERQQRGTMSIIRRLLDEGRLELAEYDGKRFYRTPRG